jgi:membrane associated rhomboid family serine protease
MPPQQPSRPSFGLRQTGPVTKGLCIAILVVSLLGSITQRSLGWGVQDLVYSVTGMLSFELWRLLTYPFAVTTPFGLIIGIVILWFFGSFFESKWGGRDFLRFFARACIGAGIIAIPLSYLFDAILPFRDLGVAEGPGSAFDAMLIALALTAPDSNVLFGFVLPMRAKTMVYILLGFQIVVGIMTGAAALSITIGGMLMGYLLTTGNWRPLRLLNGIRLWQMRRRRKGLYIVPPKDKTLH